VYIRTVSAIQAGSGVALIDLSACGSIVFSLVARVAITLMPTLSQMAAYRMISVAVVLVPLAAINLIFALCTIPSF
jgi:hypothetical protein